MHGTIGLFGNRVTTGRAATGLCFARVDVGDGESAIYPGYLSEDDARAAGRRFAMAMGAVAVDLRPPVDSGMEDCRPPRCGHGDATRRGRRQARAMKRAWLDSLV